MALQSLSIWYIFSAMMNPFDVKSLIELEINKFYLFLPFFKFCSDIIPVRITVSAQYLWKLHVMSQQYPIHVNVYVNSIEEFGWLSALYRLDHLAAWNSLPIACQTFQITRCMVGSAKCTYDIYDLDKAIDSHWRSPWYEMQPPSHWCLWGTECWGKQWIS